MSEALPDHQIQGVCGTRIRTGAQRILGHDVLNGHICGFEPGPDDPEGEIFGGEDSSYAIVVIGDEYTVFPLRGHQLCCFGDGRLRFHLQCVGWLQREDGARRCFTGLPRSSGIVMLLLGEIRLDLATDGLDESLSVYPVPFTDPPSTNNHTNSPHPSCSASADWHSSCPLPYHC